MTASQFTGAEIRVADLSARAPNPFRLVPDADTRAAMIAALGLSNLRKVVLDGEISSQGQRDWCLTATLGATAVQPCVATLAPVTTRIEQPVVRRFLAEGLDIPEDDETEMNQDVTLEALRRTIDLQRILEEALALALPDYPRAADAEYVQAVVAPGGVTPLSDDDVRPFAALAALKGKLQNDD